MVWHKGLKKSVITTTLLMALAPSFLAHALDLSDVRNDLSFGYDGEINTNAAYSSASHDNVNLDDSFVSLSAQWRDKVKAVVSLKIQEALKNQENSFKWPGISTTGTRRRPNPLPMI